MLSSEVTFLIPRCWKQRVGSSIAKIYLKNYLSYLFINYINNWVLVDWLFRRLTGYIIIN